MPRRLPPGPPPARIDATPQCRHFGTCGGCSLLDQPIAWQLEHKRQACEQLLAPFLGGVRLAMPEPRHVPTHFRTRVLYPIRADQDGQPSVGIYAFRSHDLVRIDECRTQDVWLTEFGKAAERVLREHRVQPFHPTSGRGHAKAFWARLAAGSGEVLAGIVTRPGAWPEGAAVAAALQAAAAAVPPVRQARKLVGIVHSLSERDDAFLLGERHVPLRGRDHVIDEVDDLRLRIGAGSFYQIHGGAHRLLYGEALRMIGPVRGQQVIDGYGGVGAFGLRLAKAGAASVLVVEDNPSACRDAEWNAKTNRLAQVTVQRQPFATAELPVAADLLVVDPPRSGLGTDGALRLLGARPARVLHVACDAESLARDLGTLCANGYRVTAMRLCDLFPHTEHVELLTMLERRT